jgi:hypothetical protein
MYLVHVPAGFVSVAGNLYELADDSRLGASAAEIEALYQGEDLAHFEHLLLHASVDLGVNGGAFHVRVYAGDAGAEIVDSASATFGDALRDLRDTLGKIWDLELPWRSQEGKAAKAMEERATSCFPPAGWTILVDQSAPASGRASQSSEAVELMFAATSSYRSIAAYRIVHTDGPAPYAGVLWAEPVGMLYERLYFDSLDALITWVRTRLQFGSLPRRKRRP